MFIPPSYCGATWRGRARVAAPAAAERRPGRLLYLDALRGIAILLVLGYHPIIALQPFHHGFTILSHWGLIGWTGVDLFFVLSGFLIGGLLVGEYEQHQQINLARFYIRRGLKIWPAYLVFMLAISGYLLLFHRHSPALHTDGAADVAGLVWPYFIPIQNYYMPLRPLIVHTWSLAVEEHFYLVLPIVLVWAMSRRRGRANLDAIPWLYATVAIACLGWRILNRILIPNFGLEQYYFPTHLRIDSLMAGVLLCWLVRFRVHWLEPLRKHRWPVLLLSVGCYLPNLVLERDATAFQQTIGLSLLAWGSMGFVLLAWFADQDLAGRRLAATGGKPAHPPLPGRLLAWIGLYSYSIYLWHLPFPHLLLERVATRFGLAEQPWGPPAVTLLYLALSICIGMAMYHLVERPVLMLRDRFYPSRTRRATDHIAASERSDGGDPNPLATPHAIRRPAPETSG